MAIMCGVARQGLTEKVTVEVIPGEKEEMVISGGGGFRQRKWDSQGLFKEVRKTGGAAGEAGEGQEPKR